MGLYHTHPTTASVHPSVYDLSMCGEMLSVIMAIQPGGWPRVADRMPPPESNIVLDQEWDISWCAWRGMVAQRDPFAGPGKILLQP